MPVCVVLYADDFHSLKSETVTNDRLRKITRAAPATRVSRNAKSSRIGAGLSTTTIVLTGDFAMKNNIGRIPFAAFCAVLAILGICPPLIAQNEGSWQLVKIQASAAGYGRDPVVKDLPPETRERKGIFWGY